FSRDGRLLAEVAGTSIRLWDFASRTEHILPPEALAKTGRTLAISPDGKILAVSMLNHTIKLWDLVSDHDIGELKLHSKYVEAVAFSPDGRTLATGGEDETVKLWDTRSWQEVLTLKTDSWVKSLAFSPQGNI